ncbi:dexamethasone-induced Ras-related protein 1 [Xiphophorus hellerii]|uniref:dexamethasone-induced Ras-related protein 1 n=1 Tax=Xiphophorus hellerii TaxID=8084 RepID=UPI0013B36928|nr:dexamethasone-induced Ras-related protein 1-like [Xiphophorus hellerii]
MEMGSISTGAPTSSVSVRHQLKCAEKETHLQENNDGQCSGLSKVWLAYKHASQQLSSSGIKAGLGLLKVATSQWKEEKKTGGAKNSHPAKRSSLDQLTDLVFHGPTRRSGLQHRPDPLYLTKPQNCKRIVVLGAPRVGKTAILRRYLRDGFVEEYSPTSEDFLRKLFCIRGETYQIDILDASRERDFPAKRRLSILTGDIFLLVFSLDDRSSFEEVCNLREEILAAKSKLTKSSVPGHCAQPRVPLVVCANKADLDSQRGISRAEVLKALGGDCTYFETSAKDSTNLDKVFETLAKRGGLPTETGPFQHRKVSLRSYQAMRTDRAAWKGGKVERRDDPCGTLYPLARRPSFTTDLRQIIGPRKGTKPGQGLEKCQIQ